MTTIRNATPDDAQALLDIYTPYVTDTAITFELVPPTVQDFAHRIAETLERFPYIVACDEEGRILGYSYAHTLRERAAYNHCVEVSIYIDRTAHHQGLGRMLYAELERRLEAQGIRNLYASVTYNEVESQHAPHTSRLFHERMGYRLVGCFHRCGRKFDEWFDMIWMEKIIGR